MAPGGSLVQPEILEKWLKMDLEDSNDTEKPCRPVFSGFGLGFKAGDREGGARKPVFHNSGSQISPVTPRIKFSDSEAKQQLSNL